MIFLKEAKDEFLLTMRMGAVSLLGAWTRQLVSLLGAWTRQLLCTKTSIVKLEPHCAKPPSNLSRLNRSRSTIGTIQERSLCPWTTLSRRFSGQKCSKAQQYKNKQNLIVRDNQSSMKLERIGKASSGKCTRDLTSSIFHHRLSIG